jgi:hypothetical protein
MKNLVLSALFLAATVPATGCIFVDDDDNDDDGPSDDDPIDEPTQLNVTWSLVSNAEARGCLPGANATATLYACAGTCPAGAQPYSDITDCPASAGTGTIATDPLEALPPGNYIIWVEFAADGVVYAKSFSDPVTLVAGGTVNHAFEVQIDHGFFDASWTLVRGDAAISCDAAGAVDIELLPSACNTAGGVDCFDLLEPADVFECNAGSGQGEVPRPFSAFGYEVGYAALDSNGENLATVEQSAGADPFAYGNEAQNLGQLVIETD